MRCDRKCFFQKDSFYQGILLLFYSKTLITGPCFQATFPTAQFVEDEGHKRQ